MSDVYDRLAQWMRENLEADVYINQQEKSGRWTCAFSDWRRGVSESYLDREEAITQALDEWSKKP